MSYGTNAPQGFQDDHTVAGSLLNSALSTYPILSAYATSIFTGDPVVFLANGTIGLGVGGAAGEAVTGVFKGVIYVDTTNTTVYAPYWTGGTALLGGAASTAAAFVIDDPNVEFNIQVNTTNAGVHTATVNQTDLNLNANFVIGAGSTRSGQSATFLDAATIAATATFDCKILRLVPIITPTPNVFGLLFNNVIVKFNNHVLNGGTGTLGV
jgi:hypothetical protein